MNYRMFLMLQENYEIDRQMTDDVLCITEAGCHLVLKS